MGKANTPTGGFSTRAIHFGYNPADHQGALVPPIYTSATFAFPDVGYGARCFSGEENGYFYTRIANPTLALLEGAAGQPGAGRGRGGVWLGHGCDHGHAVVHAGAGRRGAGRHDAVRLHVFLPEPWPRTLWRQRAPCGHDRPRQCGRGHGSDKTRVVYFESPANPNMRLVDIAAVSALAHAGGAKVVVDNTYCTPYLQQPLLLGADVSVHSMTKYLGGHGDLTAGAAIFADAELAQRVRLYGLKDMTGAVMSAQDAHLVMRGLKTLALRMDRHCQSAQTVAELLPRTRPPPWCTSPACPALRSMLWRSSRCARWAA